MNFDDASESADQACLDPTRPYTSGKPKERGKPKMDSKTYSNPQTSLTVNDWPYGSMRTTAMFYVETHPTRGQRAVRRTVDPKTGRLSAPKAMTYARQVRIVDGSDGRTYIAELTPWHVSIMQSNMKFQEESVFETDPRFTDMLNLFKQEEAA